MIAAGRYDVDRMAVVGSILLMISAACLSAACASAGRNRPSVLQSTPAAEHGGVPPGSWERVEGREAGLRCPA